MIEAKAVAVKVAVVAEVTVVAAAVGPMFPVTVKVMRSRWITASVDQVINLPKNLVRNGAGAMKVLIPGRLLCMS